MNIEVKQIGNKLEIIFNGNDVERGNMTKDEINDKLADLQIARELSDEEFDALYDEGKVEIELDNKREDNTKRAEQENTIETNQHRDSAIRRNSMFSNVGYKVGKRKIYEYLEQYIDDDYWITGAVIRSGFAAYRVDMWIDEVRDIWTDTVRIAGPDDIKILKCIADEVVPNCSGMDNREVYRYRVENKSKTQIYIEFITYNGNQEIKGKYTLEKRIDFLKRYGLEI